MQYPPNSSYGPQGQAMPPLYENHYMGFYIRVYPDHIEFKNAQGSQVAHLSQITSVQTGIPLFMGITITINGQSQMIPTSKKKEVERAILDAQARFITVNPQVQPRQSQVPMQSSMQQPMGTPIDAEIQRVKMEIEQRRLQLSQVNANMSNIRAHYQQKHVHGGGQLGSFVRGVQRSTKDAQLKKQQPIKERLQREKLALEQQLSKLKMLKAQGITHITH
jgi:hypothetical protein